MQIVITNQPIASTDDLKVISFDQLAYTDEYGDKSYLTVNGSQYDANGNLITWLRLNLTELSISGARHNGSDMHGSTGRFTVSGDYAAKLTGLSRYAQDCVGQTFKRGSGLQLTKGSGIGLGSIVATSPDAYIAFEVEHNGNTDMYEGYNLTPIGIGGTFEVRYAGRGKSTTATNTFDMSSLLGNSAPATIESVEAEVVASSANPFE